MTLTTTTSTTNNIIKVSFTPSPRVYLMSLGDQCALSPDLKDQTCFSISKKFERKICP